MAKDIERLWNMGFKLEEAIKIARRERYGDRSYVTQIYTRLAGQQGCATINPEYDPYRGPTG